MPEPLEPPEDKPKYICEDTSGCNEPIYEGEDYYRVDGYILCEDCGRRYLDELYKKRA
jgi:formylmethanofuran dehydrogenase subunit E